MAEPGTPTIGNPDAKRLADVVMKGGITSGIVYPWAVCELSRSFLFRSIGGTSAGAIASALTAAAEYRRRTFKSSAGFEELQKLPQTLARDGFFLELFRPDHATRGLFGVLERAISARGTTKRVIAAVWGAMCARPEMMLGLVPGIALIVWAFFLDVPELSFWILVLLGVVLAIGLMAAVLGALLQREAVRLDRNYFGLCRGTAPHRKGEAPSLTNWLAEEIDRVAGKTDAPLTFGDLWDAPFPEELKSVRKEGDLSIELKAVTTCLTQGRPYELPFREEKSDHDHRRHGFYFCKSQFDDLFPKRVVDWMVKHSDAERAIQSADGKRTLLPLPAPRHMPVIVAARMSLSFPVLISAIPLWGIDSRVCEDDEEKAFECWFSDGGITSNFPMHFFDSVIPAWPTFGLNLRYFPADPSIPCGVKEDARVWLPKRNSDGALDSWSHLSRERGVNRVTGFVGLIQEAAMSWNDNSLLRLPGYRDRVAEIWLKPDEGGMNLRMKSDVVLRLAGFGREAGEELRKRFSTPHDKEENPMSWENHRARRAHGGLDAVRQLLGTLPQAIRRQLPADVPIQELLTSDAAEKHGVTWCRRFRPRTLASFLDLCTMGDKLTEDDPFRDPPRPTIEYRPRAQR